MSYRGWGFPRWGVPGRGPGGVPGGVPGVSYDPRTRPECERARRNAIGVGGIGRQALAIKEMLELHCEKVLEAVWEVFGTPNGLQIKVLRNSRIVF